MKGERELFAECGIDRDDKARRRINISEAIGNITAEEIERDGVTWERLQTIGVPVLRYGTQITIHGSLPDCGAGRVGGYKAIINNGNGTIGVKYVAIDNGKKRLMQDVLQATKPCAWHIHIDSTDCYAARECADREECASILQAAPCHLYSGTRYGVADPWGSGRYWAVLSIGAVLEENVWPLIRALGGMDKDAFEAYKATETQRRAEQQAQWKKECAEAQKQTGALEAALDAKLATLPGRLTAMPSIPCSVAYYYLSSIDRSERKAIYQFSKGPFGKTYQMPVSVMDKKRRVADMDVWKNRIQKGRVFAALS